MLKNRFINYDRLIYRWDESWSRYMFPYTTDKGFMRSTKPYQHNPYIFFFKNVMKVGLE